VLGIDVGLPFGFAAPAVVPVGGTTALGLAVPGGLARGSAFAAQAVVFGSTGLQLGLPVTFVVR
jgi:hypothetical protein